MSNPRQGAALVEFALMALVLYLLVAGGVELGRCIFVSQVLQDAARVAARELSVTPLRPDCTFEDALADHCDADGVVMGNIWNENLLVIDTSCYPTDGALNLYLDSLPLVNRALRPVFISDSVNGRKLLRYPGALRPSGRVGGQSCPDTYDPAKQGTSNPSDLKVEIFQLKLDGTVNTTPLPVMTEVGGDPLDPASGPFSFASTGSQKGIAVVAIHYPFQSAMMSGFRSAGVDAHGAPNPNLENVIVSDDTDKTLGTYTGEFGLGNQAALNNTADPNRTVRPYRILLLGQAMFRREVTQ
jgi:hypothetical protein